MSTSNKWNFDNNGFILKEVSLAFFFFVILFQKTHNNQLTNSLQVELCFHRKNINFITYTLFFYIEKVFFMFICIVDILLKLTEEYMRTKFVGPRNCDT